MEFFSAYILSIVGIVLLGVIVDLVLVDGQVKKYVKSIFVLFVIFTLVAPLPNLINNVKKGEINLPTSEIEINESYLDIILKQKNTAIILSIEKAFEDDDIKGVTVSVDAEYKDNIYTINQIVIDLEKVNYSVSNAKVIEIVQSVVKIDKEAIKIYD